MGGNPIPAPPDPAESRTASRTGETSGRGFRTERVPWRTVTVKIVLILTMFLAVPVLVYDQLRAAAEDNNRLLSTSIEAQGRLTAEALRPWLDKADGETMRRLGEVVTRLGRAGPDIKLLFRPTHSGQAFFYVASSPTVASTDYLERERQELMRLGVLDRLSDSCDEVRPAGLRFVNPGGGVELLTSITPILSGSGCWVVITGDRSPEVLASAIGRPYWTTTAVRTAAAIYLVMALAVTVLLWRIWAGLSRFARLARALRSGTGEAREASSFATLNRVPELAGIAAEFDRLVAALRASADALRFAAHETAHAFKTPLGVISQSLEPLRRKLAGDARAERSLELIGKSLERLDGLVSAARRLDETLADTIDPPRELIALDRMVREIVSEYAEANAPETVRFETAIEPGCRVIGAASLVEIIMQNLLDNAISFSPPGGTVTVTLNVNGEVVELMVGDRGPGADPDTLATLFDRYVSLRDRPAAAKDSGKGVGAGHFGIGLWIVRRNVEAMGGVVAAENRRDGGFKVLIALPRAA